MKKEVKGQLFSSYKWLSIKAKEFANELTSYNIIEKDLKLPSQVSKEQFDNENAVKDILFKRGVNLQSKPLNNLL